MKRERIYRFLDVEASSLGEASYPIEVAWSATDYEEAPHCWLIAPSFVETWTDWDLGAQAVHGISRSRLAAEGVEPSLVAAHMNQSVGGETLYCDGGEFDIFWIDRLFEAAGVQRRFRIGDARQLFHRLLDSPSVVSNRDTIVDRLAEKARRAVGGRRHRAAVDVQYLEHLCDLVQIAE
jgi:hypothetical protein